MSEQSKVPTAAELRELAGWCEGELLQVSLLAGAVAMERTERLAEVLLTTAHQLSVIANAMRRSANAALAQEGGA